MKIQEYLALDREQLHAELARMGRSQRAKFDAQLAMLCALQANTIEARKLPAYMIAGGKTIAFEKQQMTCRASVCRAPHKNRR